MKNLLVLFLVLAASLSQSVFADEVEKYCAKEPYEYSKGFGSFLYGITGANFLVQQITEHEVAKSLKDEFGTKFDVYIKTFGGSNLHNGKFEKITLKGKNIQRKGIYASYLEAETLCPFNHVELVDKQFYYAENMVLKYSAKINANDLKKTIDSEEYKKAINKMSLSVAGHNIAKVSGSSIDIINDKIVMSYNMDFPVFLATMLPNHVTFTAGLDVNDGKINFSNIKANDAKTNTALKTILPIINYINPLKFELQADKNTVAKVNLKNAKIVNNEIILDGIAVLPKNYNVKQGN